MAYTHKTWITQLTTHWSWTEETLPWKREDVWWIRSELDPNFTVRIDRDNVVMYDDNYGGNSVGSWKTSMDPKRTGFRNIFNHNSTEPTLKNQRRYRQGVERMYEKENPVG